MIHSVNGEGNRLKMEVLFVILIGSFITSVELLANQCGKLTFSSNSVTEGETATLVLNSTLQITERRWQIGDHTDIYNSSTPEKYCKYAEEKQENGYKLNIYHVDRFDAGYYYVRCYLPGGTMKLSTASPTLRITSNVCQENDSHCGILIARQNDVIEGDNFELSFKSYNIQQTIKWQKVTNGQFSDINNQESNNCGDRITLLKVKGSGSWNITKETYRVSCGQTFSNVVNITKVHDPPEKPTFVDVLDIQECKNCIAAQVFNRITVKCNSMGGSHEWYFKLFMGNNTVNDTVIKRSERKTLTYDFTPTIQDINTEFKCIVQKPGAQEELVETAKVLIYVKPSKIQVTGLSVKENQNSEIQCTTYGGRPQLQPSIYINKNRQDSQIIESIPTNNTYTVRAGLNKTFSRRNNNHSVSCCVKLLVDSECTKDIHFLNVSYTSPKSSEEKSADNSKQSLIGPVIGGVAAVIAAVIACTAFCLIRHRQKENSKTHLDAKQDDNTTQHLSHEATERVSQRVRTAQENNSTRGSMMNVEIPEYASVAPKATRAVQKNEPKQTKKETNETAEHQLVYAELDLQTQPIVKQEEKQQQEATEYVGIDFAKTGTVKEEDFVEYRNM